MNALQIIGLILFVLISFAIVWGTIYLIIISIVPANVTYVTKRIKSGKDIDKSDVDYICDYEKEKYKNKIEQLLNEKKYKLVERKTPEVVCVVGYGKSTFNDGTNEYHIYTSKNSFSKITKEQYDYFKKQLNNNVTISRVKEVYTRKDF